MKLFLASFALFVLAGCETLGLTDSPAPADATTSTKAAAPANLPDPADIAVVLDSFHDAAAKADEDRYFNLYAPDAVFLGTDAKERWTLEEFRGFAHPYFAKGKAWTYLPIPGTRHISIEGKDHDVAWFDEQLENAKLGICRGSGVLVKVGNDWKVKQYNLTILVPNEIAEKVAAMGLEEIKREKKAAPKKP
jgi:hypothetical protein